MRKIDVAIIGGGVAGLSAAVACCRAGVDAHVFEAAPQFQPLGTSLSLWPNAMRCLTEWGLDTDVTSCGRIIEQLAWRRTNGQPYFVHRLKPIYEELGHHGICVRRSDLHKHLAAAIPTSRLHLNHQLASATETEGGDMRLRFENGQIHAAVHVIAADGLWSQLRNAVMNDGDPNYSGYGAWLGLSPIEAPAFGQNEACEFIGSDARLGIIETGHDTRYWFVVANRATPVRHVSSAPIDDVLRCLEGWPEHLRDFVKGTSPEHVVYSSFFERPVAAKWGRGRITFVGDAMHPFVPNLGQGACQAIEDGHTITCGLIQGLRGEALNNWMSAHRLARVRYLHRTTSRIGNLVQNPSRISRWIIQLLGLPPFRQMSYADIKKQFAYLPPKI